MNDSRNTEAAATWATGIAGVLTATGVLMFALFPLAIPFLLLTAVFTAPLLLPVLVVAIPVGFVALVVLVVRAVATRRRGARPAPRTRPAAVDFGATRSSYR
jgi:NADH:ubiquinone oxidoreductase subunit 6 (subunit J)